MALAHWKSARYLGPVARRPRRDRPPRGARRGRSQRAAGQGAEPAAAPRATGALRYRRPRLVAGRALRHLSGLLPRSRRDGRAHSPRLEALRAAGGQYDFSLFDRVFPRLAAAGLELTVYFVTVPAWATSNPSACEIDEQEFCDFPPSREAQYRAAVRAALTRY